MGTLLAETTIQKENNIRKGMASPRQFFIPYSNKKQERFPGYNFFTILTEKTICCVLL
jgi:hypothetical protein